MESQRQAALIPAALGAIGAIFGLTAMALWFADSASGIIPILAGVSACCCVASGWAAYRMSQAVTLAEKEVNKAIDLLVATARQPKMDENGNPVIDSETNLPGEEFFELAVKGRVAAARRHLWPVSVVLLDIRFQDGTSDNDERVDGLNQFVGLLRQTLRESDLACKLDVNTFGLILDDTSEEGGVWTAERLQIALAKNNTKIRQIAAGVSTYPTHALNAEEILKRANTALARAAATAGSDGLGHVEVAHVDLS